MEKDAGAFRTIGEVAEELDVPQHVLRFWETRFPQIKPMKRAGGRRFYRPVDVTLLRAIRELLYGQGYTIKGVQRLLKEQGAPTVAAVAAGDGAPPPSPLASEERIPPPSPAFAPVAASFDSPASAAERPGVAVARPVFRLAPDDRRRLEAARADLAACAEILAGARAAAG